MGHEGTCESLYEWQTGAGKKMKHKDQLGQNGAIYVKSTMLLVNVTFMVILVYSPTEENLGCFCAVLSHSVVSGSL